MTITLNVPFEVLLLLAIVTLFALTGALIALRQLRRGIVDLEGCLRRLGRYRSES